VYCPTPTLKPTRTTTGTHTLATTGIHTLVSHQLHQLHRNVSDTNSKW
jgi:hypothetical protein